MSDGRPPVIWVVDDDEDVAAHLGLVLHRAGFEADIRSFGTAAELRSALGDASTAPDLVLLDEILPTTRGSALVAEVLAVHPRTAVRLITAAPDEVSPDDRHLGVIAKPPAAQEIIAIVRS